MGKIGRAIMGLLGLAGAYTSYKLFGYWWRIYNSTFAEITPLEEFLAGLCFWAGVGVMILAIGSIILAVTD